MQRDPGRDRDRDARDRDPRDRPDHGRDLRRDRGERGGGGDRSERLDRSQREPAARRDWGEGTAVLEIYGLTSAEPRSWSDVDGGSVAGLNTPPTGSTSSAAAPAVKGAEQDALGLIRGPVSVQELPSEMRPAVQLHSKSFDPKLFLSMVHSNANFSDLSRGREHLKESLEQRSGALKLLVEAEWDRFVGVKGATEAVFEEMKAGPLAREEVYGTKEVREALKQASTRAEQVFQPTLDARLKAERLRSTLGVFERSKFFFNLPGVLGEAVEAGKYDVALLAYKKGRYILSSRPAQLLGLPAATTPQQKLQQKRIFDKVWGQVEKIVADLRGVLGKRLRDTKRGLEEVEKTIEILLELDPTDDPVWIFFDTHHRHILQLLRSSSASSMSRINIAMDQIGPEQMDEVRLASDLRACVGSLDSLEGDSIRERAAGWEIWKLIFDLVKNLSEVVLQTLPSFWKVAKGYMEGKYQKKNAATATAPGGRDGASTPNKRSPTQCRVMTQDIITLYITLLSQFFGLSSARVVAPSYTLAPPSSTTALNGIGEPIPPFVPPNSNSMTSCHWLLRILGELTDCVNDLGGLELAGEASAGLKELVGSARWKFEEACCAAWVRDAKLFYMLETWHSDADEPSTTVYLKQITAFQRSCVVSAYRIAGGSEERASALLGPGGAAAVGGGKRGQESGIPTEFSKKVQAVYLDALYAFLDGLVELAFSAPAAGDKKSSSSSSNANKMVVTRPDADGKNKEVDVNNVDIRILLCVSNLSHLRVTLIPRMIKYYQAVFSVDLSSEVKTLMAVVDQLDKILFDDYIKRKSADVAKIIRKGVLGGAVNWFEAPKPTEVHPFIYDALLSLVLVHAQVSATARPLVARTLGALVEELAKDALEAFGKVERFGMGGMLQATLEIEFMHQTLSQHVSPAADVTLQSIYRTISQSYYRKPSANSAGELQQELEGLKRTLMASRRATALQFLCMRRPRGDVPAPPLPASTTAAAEAPVSAGRRQAVTAL